MYVYIRGYRHRLMGGSVEAAGIDDLIARRPELGSRYNVRPTQDVVVIVNEDGRPVARPMRWGLIPQDVCEACANWAPAKGPSATRAP